MRFTEHMRRLIASRSESFGLDPIWHYNGKLEGCELAEELGVPVPELVISPFDPRGETPEAPRRSVVLKPTHGCSGRGVLPLEHMETGLDPDGWYACLWPDVRRPTGHGMREWLGWAHWLRAAVELEDAFAGTEGEIAGPWIAEERIPRPDGEGLAYVWKVYCIHGRPVWMRQIEQAGRRGGRVECWRVSFGAKGGLVFTRVGRDVFVNHPRQQHAALPDPTSPNVYGYAERIATELQERTGTPFVRVDFLEGPEGFVFGEITPHPSGGRDEYLDEWDHELGRIWSAG